MSSGTYARRISIESRVTTRDSQPAACINVGLKELNRATATVEDSLYALN